MLMASLPFVSRKTLTAVRQEADDVCRALGDAHAQALLAEKTRAAEQRLKDLQACVAAIERAILEERERCARIVQGQPATQRANVLRDTILDRIVNGPVPRVSHPDLPQKPATSATATANSTSG
jgi:hypothetical protein